VTSSMEPESQTKEGAASIQEQSLKLVRRLTRSLRETWKMYRHSKTGLVGLGIVFGFLFMAVFAQFVAPYSVDFKAPATDMFVADYTIGNLTEKHDWTTTIGLPETRNNVLKAVMAYSEEGYTNVFPVSVGTSLNIVLGDPTIDILPAHSRYIEPVQFLPPFIFLLDNDTLREYTYNLQDTGTEYKLPFVPIHRSNLWNGYSFTVPNGRMALAFANETSVWMINKRPADALADPVLRTWTDTLNVTGAKIIGNPLIVDADFTNGSVLILPTDNGLLAYNIVVSRSGLLIEYVSDVRFGDVKWTKPYAYKENNATVAFEPVVSENMITYQNPVGSADQYGKERIVIATKDNKLVAFDRQTGSVVWVQPLVLKLRDYTAEHVYPSLRDIVVMGKTATGSFISAIEPATGRVGVNYTQYTDFPGTPNSPPQFVPGTNMFLLSTTDGSIFLFNELLQLNATFSAPSGGAVTPVSYLGNIYLGGINTGNYFGVVTKDNGLFTETLYGVNKAPLPPGTYLSGNRYILGTDYEGHDILTQLIYGTRSEMLVGITAAFFAVAVGTIVGLVAGYYTGFVDDILMRATDVVLSLPGLVIMLLFAAVFGPSLVNIIIIIAILSWAPIARVIRSVTLSLKERAFVDAAIIAGASESRLIFKHIAPNVLHYTFLYMTFTISGAIVTEAILAFLGFGDANYVTWGMMLQFLQISGHTLDAPWWLLPPGIAITLLSLSFYLIGRAFDEVVNPRLRRR